MEKGIEKPRRAGGNAVLDAQPGRSDWQIADLHLLWYHVVLLAMKHGRAPLPVSPAIWRALWRQGVLNDLYDLGSIARRLSFLGDGRLLLAELKLGTATRSPREQIMSKEIEIIGEGHP